ncbi:MAG: lipid-binding SYLF domain-containing protein, partial [Azospirillaceae bacterium]
ATTGAAIVEELDDARETVRGATAAIAEMKKNAELAGALQRAKGILIVPEFTKGALIIGGWGGEGVLLSHQGSAWAGPAFYDVGAVTAGAEIGFTSGTMAFLLMTDRAVDAFRTEDTFSMSANAEMTVVDFSKQFKLSTDKSDVVVWSDTEGAFVGAGGSLSDVNWDAEANNAYYRQNVTASQVLDGHVKSESTVLVDAIAG